MYKIYITRCEYRIGHKTKISTVKTVKDLANSRKKNIVSINMIIMVLIAIITDRIKTDWT